MACMVLLDKLRSLKVLGSTPVVGNDRAEVGSESELIVVLAPLRALLSESLWPSCPVATSPWVFSTSTD